MADPRITVTVERAVHDVLRQTVQNIETLHGIRVKEVRIDWYDVFAIGDKPKAIVSTVAVLSETKEGS